MARRGNSKTENTVELVIKLLFAIPLALVVIFKWIVSCCSKSKKQVQMNVESIDLYEVDAMDGWTFEYYFAELLKKNGYSQVVVTKGSGDFGVDVTATKDNKKWAFQCKNYNKVLGVSPIQEVYSGAVKYGAQVSVVVTNSYFSSHAKELAQKLGVLLWDRGQLARMINKTFEEDKDISRKTNLQSGVVAQTETKDLPSSFSKEEQAAQSLTHVLNQYVQQKEHEKNFSKESEDSRMIESGSIVDDVEMPIEILPNLYSLSLSNIALKHHQSFENWEKKFDYVTLKCRVNYCLNGRREGMRHIVFTSYDAKDGVVEICGNYKKYRFTELGYEFVEICFDNFHQKPFCKISVSIREVEKK